jgi:hypothetical protein
MTHMHIFDQHAGVVPITSPQAARARSPPVGTPMQRPSLMDHGSSMDQVLHHLLFLCFPALLCVCNLHCLVYLLSWVAATVACACHVSLSVCACKKHTSIFENISKNIIALRHRFHHWYGFPTWKCEVEAHMQSHARKVVCAHV